MSGFGCRLESRTQGPDPQKELAAHALTPPRQIREGNPISPISPINPINPINPKNPINPISPKLTVAILGVSGTGPSSLLDHCKTGLTQPGLTQQIEKHKA